MQAGHAQPVAATHQHQLRRAYYSAISHVDDQVGLAPDETVILLHPPLPLVGVSIVMERERQQNDSHVDDQVGRLLSVLRTKGLYDETLVVFTAGMSFFLSSCVVCATFAVCAIYKPD